MDVSWTTKAAMPELAAAHPTIVSNMTQTSLCIAPSSRRGRDLTWRFAARRATVREKRCGGRRVRQHRHVRRRYLRYAASSAMPTKSATTARRRIPERISTLTVYLFDQCDARLAYAQEQCRRQARRRQMLP